MNDDPRLQATQFLAELAQQAGRQGDAVERMGRAAESIARHRHPDGDAADRSARAAVGQRPRVVRVVLIQTQDDEPRLREAVQRYEAGDQGLPRSRERSRPARMVR